MTAETEHGPDESANVREARRAIEEYLSRTSGDPRRRGAGAGSGADGQPTAGDRIDDRVAECVAREAWDAVQEATPPPPDPEAGPAEKTEPSPERAELHRRAVAIARGLQELGHHLDETLRPGPDMAAG
ncbi:hypothetical protein [Streptomyces sp. NPDC048111]|uniref:hypothetical protein n=1 Tax=Streptomyces sp. NPDC048111 TaxID=3365500 RepID=UPI003715BEAA